MASQTIISVKCEPYLIKFLEALYGPSPITFPKNSNFNNILEYFLDKPPLDLKPPNDEEENLAIKLQFLENKNVVYNNYLSPNRQRVLTGEINRFFRITFRMEISKMICLGLQRQDSIEIFIEKYNLSLDCWDMLEKDYQRYLKIRSYHKQFRMKKNPSVKSVDCPAVS